MNIDHINSNRQLLNSHLKCLIVIVSSYKPINLLVSKEALSIGLRQLHFG